MLRILHVNVDILIRLMRVSFRNPIDRRALHVGHLDRACDFNSN